MKAAVLYGVGEPLVVEEVDLRDPGPHEVLIKHVASGVCHSDLNVMVGHTAYALPVVLGHEGAGIVEKVGLGVTAVQPGDHVVTSFIPTCGKCHSCSTGHTNLCALRTKPRNVMLDGTSRIHRGGQTINHYLQLSSFAEYGVLLEDSVVSIRKDAPLETVCLISCGVTTGVGAAINRAKVAPGSTVAVFGCGGVGLNVVQGARIAGAGKIIAVDVLSNKLDWAFQMGATHGINAAKDDPVEQIKSLTGGWGADYAFEAIGMAKTIEQAFDCIRIGGMAVVLGAVPAGTRISINPGMLQQERILTGSLFGSSRLRVDVPMLVDLYMDGRIKIDELVSRRLGLDEINTAFDLLREGEVARSVIVF